MRNGFLVALAALVADAASARAQTSSPYAQHLPAPAVAAEAEPALLPAPPGRLPPTLPTTAGAVKPSATAPAVTCLPEPCTVCKPAPRLWGGLEYLVWFNRNEAVPPLATLGPSRGFGVLTTPGTVVALGGRGVDFGAFNGVRATAGGWFNTDATVGVEAGGFLLERRSDSTRLTDTPALTTALARPFVNAGTGAEDAIPIAFPGVLNGSVYAKASSRAWGADADFVVNCRKYSLYRVDLLGGFRYFDLLERLNVGDLSTDAPNNTSGTAIFDQFGTRNQFYGGQVGARAVVNRGRLELTVASKLALGFTHEASEIGGTTTFFGGGMPTLNVPGGLLAEPSNSGRLTRDRFSVLSESTVAVGYRMTERLSASVGYNFLYLSDVARPAEQIDRTVNTSQLSLLGGGLLVGAARPAREIVGTDYWLQGVQFGVSYKY
jgi:hypothetical protein